MPRPLLFALFLAIAAPSHAEMYQWTDENGRVHFSDKKSQDSTEVTVKEGNNFQGREAQERALRAARADRNWSKPHYQDKRGILPDGPQAEDAVAQRKMKEQRRRDYMETCKRQRRVNCSEDDFQKEESIRSFRDDPRVQQDMENARRLNIIKDHARQN